jgi:CDP-diacylglycerol--glycerol-3-phosphate 3-phosphatidyltransferase
MVSQVVAISCVMLGMHHPSLRKPGVWLMWAVVFFAVLSAVSYFRKFWRKIDTRIKKRGRRELLILERKRQRALLRRQRGLAGGAGLGGNTILKPPEVS